MKYWLISVNILPPYYGLWMFLYTKLILFQFLYDISFCVRCILHTLTSTNVTILHINNQTCYRSLVYTVWFFNVFVVFYTQSIVLKLQYHMSKTKHSTVPVFIRYVLVCVPCILYTITSTKVTISHINNQALYRSLVYTVCSCMCSLYFTHNHLY